MLRIIAGKYRHMIIKTPEGLNTRPTSDRVREALMSAISDYLRDSIVLDLFSGSGALAIEALSRGAKKAYLCDNSKSAINVIKNNLSNLKINNAEIIFEDYKIALEILKKKNIKFDIVFLDPPYRMKETYDYVVKYLTENNLLTQRAIIIEESDLQFEKEFGKSKHYKYGKTYIRITKEIMK